MNGKHFCVLPFMHMHMESSGDLSPCCINSEALANIRDGRLADLWNSDGYVRMREAMLRDEYIPSCEICYSQERGKGQSLRTHSNTKFEKFAVNAVASNPVYFDLRFSNICNLKCRSCEHKSSSLWFEDATVLGSAAATQAVINASDDPDALLAQIRAYIPDAVEFYFAGGEPLVMEEHYKVLTMLMEEQRTDVRLVYNSNFMKTRFKGKSVFEYWEKFSDVTLCVSLDAIDETAAYVRKGTRFADIVENRRLLGELTPHVKVVCSPTISLLNIGSLTRLLQFVLDTGFCQPESLHLNILEYPLHYNIKAAPESVKAGIRTELTRFASSMPDCRDLAEQLAKVVAYMESGELPEQLGAFKEATLALDGLRHESYLQAFADDDPVKVIFNMDRAGSSVK